MATDIPELMLRDVALVLPDVTVQEAARAMAESDCRVVLIGQESAIEGVLTEHDILIRVVAAGLDPGQTCVEEVMSAELFTCREDQSLDQAAAEMAEHRVNQLPVLDGEGRLAGLLTYLAARRGAEDEDARHVPRAERSTEGAEPTD